MKRIDKVRDKEGKSGKRSTILILHADDPGWPDPGCIGGGVIFKIKYKRLYFKIDETESL